MLDEEPTEPQTPADELSPTTSTENNTPSEPEPAPATTTTTTSTTTTTTTTTTTVPVSIAPVIGPPDRWNDWNPKTEIPTRHPAAADHQSAQSRNEFGVGFIEGERYYAQFIPRLTGVDRGDIKHLYDNVICPLGANDLCGDAWNAEISAALDYLGADPTCIYWEYWWRFKEHFRLGAGSSQVPELYGWHNCATIIDPLVKDCTPNHQPDRKHDIGCRLSDYTTWVEQCQAVIPADAKLVYLEEFYEGFFAPTRYEINIAESCNEWVTEVNANDYLWRSYPQSARAAKLAIVWFQHFYGFQPSFQVR